MNLAASFVAYCVSGLSCPTCSAVPTSDLSCCVSCSSRPSAPSRKPFTYRYRPRCHSDFPLRLLELLLAVETKLVSHCQCVFRIVRPGETFSVPSHLPVPMRSMIFTLNTSRIICSRSSAMLSGMPKMKSSLQCTPSASSVAPQYKHGTHRISLKAMIVQSFLHVRRKHLTRVTSSVETLEQSPDLLFLAKVLWWHHVDYLSHFSIEERHRNVKHSDDH